MAFGYIYKIVNKVNGKSYVGQTIYDIKTRFRNHKHASHTQNTYLYKAMRKYGFDNFTIEEIDVASNLEELNNKEIYWIKELNTKVPNGYNIVDGGGGVKGYHHTKKTKLICKQKSIGNHNAVGKHNLTDEGRLNMILAHKGKPSTFKGHTDNSKKKLSISHSKRVMCVETQMIYPNCIIASQKLEISNHIGRCCNGKRKTCGGYHWIWV